MPSPFPRDNWKPPILFSGSVGLVIDPSWRSALTQDAAGTVPVTAAGQPVGRVLDQSGGARHMSQAVSAARPTLGRHPRSGRRNLLTWTEDFSRAEWDVRQATLTYGQPDPFGGTSAVRVVLSGAEQGFGRYLYGQVPVGSNVTGSFWIRGTAGETIRRKFHSPGEQNITLTGAWQYVSGTGVSSTVNDMFNISTWGGATARDVLICRPQLEIGSTATNYQRVTTQFDRTEAGQPDVWYLSMDAIDDFLATDAINWASDEVTIIAAMRKRSDAETQIIAEFGTNSGAVDGTFGLLVPGSLPGYRSRSRGTLDSEATVSAGYPADGAHVVTLRAKIGTDVHMLRVNGVGGGSSAADQGTGLFSNQQLFIGRRAGTSLAAAIDLYGLIAINRVLTDAELSRAEKWAASRMGFAL